MYANIPSAVFQWMAFGAEEYLATDRSAFEISGRVEVDNETARMADALFLQW